MSSAVRPSALRRSTITRAHVNERFQRYPSQQSQSTRRPSVVGVPEGVLNDSGVLKEPLQIGDCIYLSLNEHVIEAEGFEDVRLGLRNSRPLNPGKEAENFAGSIFMVTNQLSYSAQQALTSDSKPRKSVRRNSSIAHLAMLREQVEREKDHNAKTLSSTKKAGAHVDFGMIVQLKHVASGKFVSLSNNELAEVQSDCMKASLHDGDSSCWIKLLPRYKVRQMGAKVYVGDQHRY